MTFECIKIKMVADTSFADFNDDPVRVFLTQEICDHFLSEESQYSVFYRSFTECQGCHQYADKLLTTFPETSSARTSFRFIENQNLSSNMHENRYKEINVIDRGSRIRIFYQKHWNFSLYLSSLTNPTKTQLNARCWRNSITFSLSGLLRWDFGRYTEIFLSRGPLDIGEVVNAAGSHCQQPTISFKSKQRDETKGKTYLSSLGFFTKTKRATNVKRR